MEENISNIEIRKFSPLEYYSKKFEGRAKGREQWIFEKRYLLKKKERRNKFRKKYDKRF